VTWSVTIEALARFLGAPPTLILKELFEHWGWLTTIDQTLDIEQAAWVVLMLGGPRGNAGVTAKLRWPPGGLSGEVSLPEPREDDRNTRLR